jgi:hypothetical protein
VDERHLLEDALLGALRRLIFPVLAGSFISNVRLLSSVITSKLERRRINPGGSRIWLRCCAVQSPLSLWPISMFSSIEDLCKSRIGPPKILNRAGTNPSFNMPLFFRTGLDKGDGGGDDDDDDDNSDGVDGCAAEEG